MTTLSIARSTAPIRALHLIGALGALLALAILGASILLRLTSVIGVDDVVRSTLPADTENAVRMVHRLSASGVGILALLVTVLGWMQRRVVPHAVKPVMLLVGATVLLAVIGPLTPGYRFGVVTVVNVVAGTVLLGSCWWLRETLAIGPVLQQKAPHPMLRLAFIVLFIHVGLGALASALEMRGTHWVSFVHAGSGMLTTLLLGSILWDRHSTPHLKRVTGIMAGLLVVQVALGVVSLFIGGRPVGLGFAHAMLSPLLAGGLVSIAVRDGTIATD